MINMERKFDYKDISLVPDVESTLAHRDMASPDIEAFGTTFLIPMIAAPMQDVCNGEMAAKLSDLGALGLIHRFQTIDEQVEQFTEFQFTDETERGEIPIPVQKRNIGCAVGVTGDFKERFEKLYEAGCRIFCLDTANGFNIQVEQAVKLVKEFKVINCAAELRNNKPYCNICNTYPENAIHECITDKIYIIAGNIATAAGYEYLVNCGVDAVRVGIAGGSVCETKTETGIYMPMVSAIEECKQKRFAIAWGKIAREEFNGSKEQMEKLKEEVKKLPLIIADGGIKEPSNLCKALAVGADFVMCGSIFAGTKESPGDVHNIDGKLCKLYRGAASFGVQKQYNAKKPNNVEGRESMVPYKSGGITKVIERYKGGLRSSMSYFNAYSLEQYRKNVRIIQI